jgi:hypothetical protein
VSSRRMCEKCWPDAYSRWMANGRSQVDNYHELLKERAGNPCSEEEQQGQWAARKAEVADE